MILCAGHEGNASTSIACNYTTDRKHVSSICDRMLLMNKTEGIAYYYSFYCIAQ